MLVLPRACTRTLSDRDGQAEITVADWALVEKYRFGSRTADYVLCRRCGVYVSAVCETNSGLRAVINTNCLDDRAAFTQAPAVPDYDGEATERDSRRRATNCDACHRALSAIRTIVAVIRQPARRLPPSVPLLGVAAGTAPIRHRQFQNPTRCAPPSSASRCSNHKSSRGYPVAPAPRD